MCALTQLRDHISQEIMKRLREEIIEAATEYHCRKGTRPDCWCSYCNLKRIATNSFYHSNSTVILHRSYLVREDKREPWLYCDFDEMKERTRAHFKEKRLRWRTLLKQEKDKA
jgi:hypothetical protein